MFIIQGFILFIYFLRKVLVSEKILVHSHLVILHMRFLRRIKLHFLLKSLLPWNLAFESFYPVLPEYLSTQSFVLTPWLCSAPHQHQGFPGQPVFFFLTQQTTEETGQHPFTCCIIFDVWGSDFFSDMFGESLGILAGPPQPCHIPTFFFFNENIS